MIKTHTLLPEIYTRESRDFQLFANWYNVLFNYVKTNVDTIINAPYSEHLDTRLLELCASSLGFEIKHKYNAKLLSNICSIFKYLLKKKGTLEAIDILVNCLLNSYESSDTYMVQKDPHDNLIYHIYLPEYIKDTVILDDIFEYILPSGIYYITHVGPYIIKEVSTQIGTTKDSKAVKLYKVGSVGQVSGDTTLNTDTYNIISGSVVGRRKNSDEENK